MLQAVVGLAPAPTGTSEAMIGTVCVLAGPGNRESAVNETPPAHAADKPIKGTPSCCAQHKAAAAPEDVQALLKDPVCSMAVTA